MDAPTVFAALVVGASLALSGAALQSVLRNPLAEPYILGLVGGASLGVALAFQTGLAAAAALAVPVSAFAGPASPSRSSAASRTSRRAAPVDVRWPVAP